jgi:hypothetical protein
VWRKRLTFAQNIDFKKQKDEKDNHDGSDAGMWHDGSDGTEACPD